MEKTYELLAGEKSSKLWQRGRDLTKDQFDRIMAIADEKETKPKPVDMHEVFGWPWREVEYRIRDATFTRIHSCDDRHISTANRTLSRSAVVLSELAAELFDGEGSIAWKRFDYSTTNMAAEVVSYARRLHEIAKGATDE